MGREIVPVPAGVPEGMAFEDEQEITFRYQNEYSAKTGRTDGGTLPESAMSDSEDIGDYPPGSIRHQAIDESAPILTCRCITGETIVLTSDGWSHVLAGHPEMEQKLQFVEWCIRRPDFVNADKQNPHRKCYYVAYVTARGRPVWVKVVVHFDESVKHHYQADGLLVTALIVSRIPKKEVRLWP